MLFKKTLSFFVIASVAAVICLCGTGLAFAETQSGFLPAGEPQVNALLPDSAHQSAPIIKHQKGESAKGSNYVPTIPLNTLVSNLNSPQFKFNIPSSGYLIIQSVGSDSYGYAYSVQLKTKGFSNYVYCSSSNEYARVIGMNKGQYTFDAKTYGDVYSVNTLFTPVKESKYSTKKKKAPKIKKNKDQKLLMITGAQKTHWYKIKNTKKHKVKLTFVTTLMDTGDPSGGVKITFYKGKKSFGSRILYGSSKIMEQSFTPYNAPGMKLKKGTYYLKVEPYKKGTGYVTFKWK